MTNREWLNGLSDEEFLEVTEDLCAPILFCPVIISCKECKLAWLKKEREEI